MTSEKTAKRRRYSAEFKAQVVAHCDASGASVAKVAMSHGINANVVHGWRQLVRERGAAAVVPREFVPVRVEASRPVYSPLPSATSRSNCAVVP